VLVAVLALVLAVGAVQPDLAAFAASPAGTGAAEAARAQLVLTHGSVAAAAQATRFGGNARWETGTLAIPGSLHQDAQVFLYVAQRHATGWSAAVEGTDEFTLLAEQGHAALAGTPSAELLATATVTAAGTESVSLSLPWATGENWRLTGGPHSYDGRRKSAWSSIDFGGPKPGVSAKARAAAPGVVVRPCANLVQVRHSGGWATSYYHLTKIAVRAGQSVARGAFLGYTSTAARCGGQATGPHVHFTLLKSGSPVNIAGHKFGGWTVRDGSRQYLGCLVKGDSRKCAPYGSIYNNGTASLIRD
jgi:LasA protease